MVVAAHRPHFASRRPTTAVDPGLVKLSRGRAPYMFSITSDDRTQEILFGVIGILLVLTFIADLLLPLGIAVWILYLFPTALAYFLWRPQPAIIIAAAATTLIILGYFFSPVGVDAPFARINRTFGVVVEWIIGVTGYVFVRGKLAVRRQEWLQTGQVRLSEALGGDQNLVQLGDSILRFLTGYLGAQAGALFVKDSQVFRRYAAYGVPARAPVPSEIALGDGLLGQAARENRSFLVNDVPDGYLVMGSALGESKPRSLLITPATADGETNAVVELGFLGRVREENEDLLKRVAEAIAVAVRSAKYRIRLQELLEETQRQAEELQTQSDQLRITNEELEEQSRALRESQARLELQQAELEQTNAQLEAQTQLLEAQRDDLSQAQQSLQNQSQELEQASRYKSEFVANMSHELRTPLNSLLIMARLLADNRTGNLHAEQVKYAETIEASGNDLLALINDILDISKIEAGKLDLRPSRIRVGSLAEKLIAAFEASASQKKISLRHALAIADDAEIETDPQRLEQVLKNFVSNAVKFTEIGSVTLGVARTEDGRIAFSVRDTGIGIAADQHHAVFEAFRQADGSINRKYGGTGLGLSISRELARLLGGEICLDSAPGKGSTFTLLLPEIYDASAAVPRARAGSPLLVQLPASPQARHAETAGFPRAPMKRSSLLADDRERLSGDSRVILVVEDDDAFARILYDLAHELGFRCVVAGTADEGVIVARQYLPHAIVLDMGLPDHTGLSVLDRLKRDVRTRHIPVHVVSVSDYTEAAMALGAAGYMLKPVKREELAQALERLETKLAQRMRRILIVEDDPKQLETLQLLLASREVEAVGAPTAADCLERLKSETFDCMVLDLSLSDASGFDLLEKLSIDDTFSFPPVIVYTGRDLSVDEELKLRKYSKSIIIKGAKSPERLLDEVTLFLHQVVSELPEQQQRMLARSLDRDASLEGRRILVVEDDIRNIFALTSIFEPHGSTVQIARNGREALQALERTAIDGEPQIDLVLMDIMMPEMDGLTATREIRKRLEWKNMPVIALTAKAMASDQEQCLAAGANDYLAKPLDVEKLLSLVRVWMPR
jgi:signal transduction histidine kinase/DNA-binding response OmpR family regulator